jgi:predicted nucleotidyltransferase
MMLRIMLDKVNRYLHDYPDEQYKVYNYRLFKVYARRGENGETMIYAKTEIGALKLKVEELQRIYNELETGLTDTQ